MTYATDHNCLLAEDQDYDSMPGRVRKTLGTLQETVYPSQDWSEDKERLGVTNTNCNHR